MDQNCQEGQNLTFPHLQVRLFLVCSYWNSAVSWHINPTQQIQFKCHHELTKKSAWYHQFLFRFHWLTEIMKFAAFKKKNKNNWSHIPLWFWVECTLCFHPWSHFVKLSTLVHQSSTSKRLSLLGKTGADTIKTGKELKNAKRIYAKAGALWGQRFY